jgi:2-keto-4-pentenoate hydratase/2-oxohepta-3-ene-1,7-dioic acid hydratase in catechol pathway
MYQHHNWQGALLDYPVSKVVCVGSNYAKHIQEMGSATPEEPVLFIKPETALCDIRQPLVLPQGLGSVHHEVELAVLIGARCVRRRRACAKAIAGYGVALDLTLRDLQGKMKKPGSRGKKPKGLIIPARFRVLFRWRIYGDPQNTPLSLKVNGEVRQQGTTADMIHKIVPLIAYMSASLPSKPGM